MRKVLGPQMPRQKPPKSPQVLHMRKRVTEPALCELAIIRLQTGSTNQLQPRRRETQRDGRRRASSLDVVDRPRSTCEETDEDGNVRIAFFDTGIWKRGVKLYSTHGAWRARQRVIQAGGTRLDAEYEAEEWNRTNKVYEDRRPQGQKDECGRHTKVMRLRGGQQRLRPTESKTATAVFGVVACAVGAVSQPVRAPRPARCSLPDPYHAHSV
jgi:hypothetical protein